MTLDWSPTLIPHGSMSRALLIGSLAVVSVGCVNFGAISSAGTTYTSQEYGNPFIQAVRDSGAHDLKCPKEQISTMNTGGELEFAAEGCGQRSVYRCSFTGGRVCQLVLISKFAK